MPKKYPIAGESRLSIEGLRGAKTASGKTVEKIVAHGERRRKRTVIFTDGTKEDHTIYVLVGALIEERGR
jgi:hypothetical protein